MGFLEFDTETDIRCKWWYFFILVLMFIIIVKLWEVSCLLSMYWLWQDFPRGKFSPFFLLCMTVNRRKPLVPCKFFWDSKSPLSILSSSTRYSCFSLSCGSLLFLRIYTLQIGKVLTLQALQEYKKELVLEIAITYFFSAYNLYTRYKMHYLVFLKKSSTLSVSFL